MCQAPGEPIPFKIVVLGDEGSSGKVDVCNLFCTGTPTADPLPLSIQRKTILVGDQSTGGEAALLELWAPPCTAEYDSLRPLYYAAADLFLILFSVTDGESLEGARERYDAEVKHFAAGCPHRDIPVILVGNYAEKRYPVPLDYPFLPPPTNPPWQARKCRGHWPGLGAERH